MALTIDEVSDIDNSADTKADLEEALHEHASDHPGLDDVDADRQTRAEMIETAEAAVEEGLTAEGKTNAIGRILNETPNAVVFPTRQAYLQIPHPTEPGRSFTMNVFGDNMGIKERESVVDPESEEEYDPTAEPDVNQIDVKFTALSDVPEWARPKVYDLIMDGDLELEDSPHEAQETANRQTKNNHQPMLDEPSTPVRMESYRDEQQAGVGDADAIFSEPSANFTRPEQKAAWTVLAKPVDGQPPLPERAEERSTDPNDLTDAELQRVERRIRQALDSPQLYAEDVNPSAFDARVFFDQLLDCEMRGMNAPRSSDEKVSGYTRPQIIKIIRMIAEEHGFDVVGTYVQRKPDEGLDQQMPETVPMTPESERKHEPNARPDPTTSL